MYLSTYTYFVYKRHRDSTVQNLKLAIKSLSSAPGRRVGTPALHAS